MPALRALPQYRLSALSHSRIETVKASAEKFGFDHAVSSTEELLNHPDVDLVVVTVRVPEHLQIVTAALEAGKSVFSEWPLGMNHFAARPGLRLETRITRSNSLQQIQLVFGGRR